MSNLVGVFDPVSLKTDPMLLPPQVALLSPVQAVLHWLSVVFWVGLLYPHQHRLPKVVMAKGYDLAIQYRLHVSRVM